jgi:hypothetical protein
VGSLRSTEKVQTIFELLPRSVEHVRWNSRDRIPDTRLQVIKSSVGRKKHFQIFTVICVKPHVASSICLRATIFQIPEGTLWTHCMLNKSGGTVNSRPLFKITIAAIEVYMTLCRRAYLLMIVSVNLRSLREVH